MLLAATFVLARLISPTDFGLFAMVVALTAVAEVFRDFGLSMAALQAPVLSQAQKSNLFWINALVGVLLSAIVFASAGLIAGFYGRPELQSVVQLLAPVYALNGLSTQFRININRAMRFGALAVCDVVPVLVGFAAAIAAAMLGWGVEALVAQQVLTAVATLILSISLARWWPGWPGRAPMGSLLSFGLSFFVTQLLTYATRNIDSVAIGRVWGPTPVGLYDRAFQLAVAPLNQINAPMSRVAIPALVRVVENPQRFAVAIREAQMIACYVTSAALLLLAGASGPLVEVLLGPDWTSAAPILSLLAVGSVFRACQQVSYWMFISHGLAAAHMRMHFVAQPVIIACTLAGLPWGASGVAAGNAAGCAAFWLISLTWAGRVTHTRIGPLAGDAARAILVFGAPAGLAAYVCSTLLSLAPIAEVLTATAAALCWYALCIALIPRVRADVSTLIRFAKLSLGR